MKETVKQGDYVMVESGLLHAVGRVGVGAANLLGIDSRRDIVNLDVCIMGQHLPQMYRERECTPLVDTDVATHGFCVACRGWGLTSVDEAATVDQVIDGQGGAVCADCGGSGRKGMTVTVVREPGSAEGHIEMAADAAEGVTVECVLQRTAKV